MMTNKETTDPHAEMEYLRRRVLELEQALNEQAEIKEALRASEELARIFMTHTPAAVAMLDNDMRYLMVSRLWLKAYGLTEGNCIGRSHYELFPDIPDRWREIHRRCLAGATESADNDPFPRADGTVDWVRWEILPWHTAKGQIGGIIIFTEVVTARKELEDRLRAQVRMVQALSTPIIPISKRTLVMPMIGMLDMEKSQHMTEQLLDYISRVGALVAILDVTGVSSVDANAADALIRIAHAVRLLGAQVVITGIRPEVAQALVNLGANLGGIVTRSTLESGIAYATSSDFAPQLRGEAPM